uniref:Hemoglobin subunit zeta n=1 Tax=Canis lupus familiaris TaxID=9615 RepID=A0A8C0S902_CANLF
MSLTKAERTIILSMWGKISTQADAIGTEALERLFASFPQTKTYFPHFELRAGSAHLRAHGAKVVAALGDAVRSLDDVAGALSRLSELHAYILRVDPVNFKVGGGGVPRVPRVPRRLPRSPRPSLRRSCCPTVCWSPCLALPRRPHGRRPRRVGQVPVARVLRPDREVPLSAPSCAPAQLPHLTATPPPPPPPLPSPPPPPHLADAPINQCTSTSPPWSLAPWRG